MDPGKTLKYNKKQLFLAEGSEGVILHNPDSKTVTKLVRITEAETKYSPTNRHINQLSLVMKAYTLAPNNIPRIYDFGFVKYVGTTSRMYSGPKEVVLARIKDEQSVATVMDLVVHTNTPYELDWSIIAQLFWVVHCVNKLGYIHNDLYWRNIMIQKTEEKYIVCGDRLIPSNGFEVKILDFGEAIQLSSGDPKKDMYNILMLMYTFEDFMKFVNGRGIKLKTFEELMPFVDGAPPSITSVFGKAVWYVLNKPVEWLKADFDDQYICDLKFKTRYPIDDLNKLLMMNNALECFEYCIQKLDGVKESKRKMSLIPFDKGIDRKLLFLYYLELRVASPFTFAPIKYLTDEGIEYDLPEPANVKPQKKYIDETIEAIKSWGISINSFDKSNYVISKDGVIVLYNLQHMSSGKKDKCKATEALLKFK